MAEEKINKMEDENVDKKMEDFEKKIQDLVDKKIEDMVEKLLKEKLDNEGKKQFMQMKKEKNKLEIFLTMLLKSTQNGFNIIMAFLASCIVFQLSELFGINIDKNMFMKVDATESLRQVDIKIGEEISKIKTSYLEKDLEDANLTNRTVASIVMVGVVINIVLSIARFFSS